MAMRRRPESARLFLPRGEEIEEGRATEHRETGCAGTKKADDTAAMASRRTNLSGMNFGSKVESSWSLIVK